MIAGNTIYALSSAPGRAGVAVIRISGPQAGVALMSLAGAIPAPRTATLARLCDPISGAAIDKGLALWFPAPDSFTGENVAELHLHGGRAVLAAAVEALAALDGFQPAEAGEFTRRAFDNGKLDLAEVEGLADLIDAETEAQRRQALRQMEGALSGKIEGWRAALTSCLAHYEAMIDFAEEALPDETIDTANHSISCLIEEIRQYIDNSRCGERLREGLHIAIIGPVNAGKSSLLNVLAQRDAAIVSETAGTTRDVVEVYLDLDGYPVVLADTAGLRRLSDSDGGNAGGEQNAVGLARGISAQYTIETEGMRRARAKAATADLKLAVFDLSDWPALEPETLALVDADTIVVLNKCDLTEAPENKKIAGQTAVALSAATGAGIEVLIEALKARVEDIFDGTGAAPQITRARHRRALTDCLTALERALVAALPELAAEDLRLALRALGRITGRVDVEDLLDIIFQDFCIGK